jgi:DNA-binding NarL/FixJ family response regulator
VFAVDGRPLVRSGLAGLARRALGGNAHALSDVDQAVAALALVKSPPRAVLLGVRPGDDPEQLIVEARRIGAPVICVLDTTDGDTIAAALAAGADAYLALDRADPETLDAALTAVEAGERVVAPELAAHAAGAGGARSITARCLEVLQSLAAGLHDDEIAAELGISTSSVRKHIAGAQERLGARTRTQVVAIAAVDGLLG